jgi:hypothetical protein
MITRKEELTYRFDVQQLNEQQQKETNKLKREAIKEQIKSLLKKWYNKKYSQPKEL